MSDVPPVIRAHLDNITPAQTAELVEWLTTLGVERDWVRPELTLMPAAAWHGPELHLSRYLTDEDGTHLVDANLRAVVTLPLVIEVAAGSWPDWLGEFTAPD